jgi:hypothetical protein
MIRTLVASCALALIAATGCAAVDDASTSASNSSHAGSTRTAAPKKDHKHKAKPKPEMTSAQRNAVESAQRYLDMSGFSKKGLIQQLSSSAGEGFSRADATYAANHVGADWKAEAVESAQSYLEMGGISKQGLIEQLSSAAGEGFTVAQARYAVNKVY